MNKYILSFALLFFVVLGFNSNVSGQTNTIYYMGSVPQSYYLNPATQPSCEIFIGIPVASQIGVKATTSGISAADYFLQDPYSDSVITPLHPNANIDEFLDKFDDTETFGLEAHSSLLSFGFRVKEMFFSFDASLRSSTTLTLSKEFVEGRVKGFENGRTYDFSDLAVENLDYSSFSINVSRNFGEQFQVGIRPKMLFGLGALNTINNNSSLYTSTDEWILNADSELRMSAIGVTIPVDEDGVYDSDEEIVFDSTIISPKGYEKIVSNNYGFGVDIGAHYMPISNLQFSLSVLDLGYIKWRENNHVAKVNGEYTYNGFDVMGPDSLDFAESILDSLKENLNLSGSDEAFSTTLIPKVMVGARYFLSQGFDLGVLYRADFYPTFIDHDVIFSANWRPLPAFSLSGSYSVLSKTYSTFGLGLGFKIGPLNIYMVMDDVPLKYNVLNTEDVPLPIPLPIAQSNYNVRFGVNLVFGCNQKKKLRQDKPLFNSSDWIL